jgi:hypothetical protein
VTKIAVPPGHVLIRVEDFTALLAARKPEPAPPQAEHAALPDAAATWQGLAAVVALLTARLGGYRIGPGDVADDVPPAAIVAAMLTLTAAALTQLLDDHGEALLRDLGLLAAREGTQ